MNTLTKSASLSTLDLPVGDHWVRFHVAADTISFEVAASIPPMPAAAVGGGRAFVNKWSGKGRVLPEAEMGGDARLAALTAKHVR